MSASTLAGQLRGIFGRRIEQPAAVQPVCPWFGAVDAKRFAAECTPGDRFVIRDPTGIAKRFRRNCDVMIDPTDELCIGWTLLTHVRGASFTPITGHSIRRRLNRGLQVTRTPR